MRKTQANYNKNKNKNEKSCSSNITLMLHVHKSPLITVSFFGDGHISMPLQEAKMSTNIRVKFRTQQENAFIFMAAGRHDYCLMRLEMGAISFTYQIDQNKVQVNHTKIESKFI